MSLLFAPAARHAPMIGVLYRDGQPTGDTIPIEAGDPVPECFAPGWLDAQVAASGIPAWHEWSPGRKIELTGVYPHDGGMLAVCGATDVPGVDVRAIVEENLDYTAA